MKGSPFGIIVERDVDIPMRDGVVLRANVFRPDSPGRFPGIVQRTPYGKGEGGMDRYVRAGYVCLSQDSRGRYASEGDYVPFTVEETGDAEDGYDTVEWFAEQPYCNGRIATIGRSYNAWMQWQLARLRPPHLVAMCACSIPLELTDVDWWGAFRPARRVHWWLCSMAPDMRKREGLSPPHTPAEAREIWAEVEQGRWLGHLPWMDIPGFLPARLAGFVEDWLRHPSRRPWKLDEVHREVEVPNLDFSGWYDHCGGTMRHLRLMQEHGRTAEAREQSKLIIGPWNHGGLGSRKMGNIDFGPGAEFDIEEVMLRWLDHWLRDADNGIKAEPAVRYFVMGSGEWKSAETWPPRGGDPLVYYLDSDGAASPAQHSGALRPEGATGAGYDEYVYDPRDPVPTLWTRQLFTVPSDRRRLEYRRDILYYTTPPLEMDVEIVGYPEVFLSVSSSAPDTDFFARLVDEDPEGPAIEICHGMMRVRHRKSLDTEDLLEPGEICELHIELGPTACRFVARHRIRLEITSSDFPNHDRNHNTGGNDLTDTRLEAAHQRVHHSSAYASRLAVMSQG